MNAKEKFDEEEFTLETIRYTKVFRDHLKNKGREWTIEFNDRYVFLPQGLRGLTPEIIEAIYLQCKELGWL